MRIAFLTKRHYMRHDVIGDRYGRLYQLPFQMARRGHDVLGICLSYRSTDALQLSHPAEPGRLEWHSSSVGKVVLPGLVRHAWRAARILQEFAPDIVLGASDALHIALARHLARRLDRPFAVDLYDNFESFGLTRIPFVRHRYREAVVEAGAVSCVSGQLAEMVREEYRATGIIATIESTVAGNDFFPLDRQLCRKALGLPAEAKLIGTAGALHASRGIEDLFSAFRAIAERDPRVHLVLAGLRDRRAPIPESPRVHYLGQLRHDEIPRLYGALDVGIICVRDTAFGRYSFPQKAYEMAAMRIPLVVAAVGAMRDLFKEHPDCLYRPGAADDLGHKILRQLTLPIVPPVGIPTWAEQASRLERMLLQAITRQASHQAATADTGR